MTAPQTAWVRLAWALGLGMGLGLFYGFLRPLRRRIHWPADLLFVAAAFYAWVYLSFGVCRGDIRMGATAAMGLGALTWEMTLGRLLRKPFFVVWKGISWLFGVIFLPIRKIFEITRKICKKVFASAKKKGYNRME